MPGIREVAQTVGPGCRVRWGNPFDNSPKRNLDALGIWFLRSWLLLVLILLLLEFVQETAVALELGFVFVHLLRVFAHSLNIGCVVVADLIELFLLLIDSGNLGFVLIHQVLRISVVLQHMGPDRGLERIVIFSASG
jgi:hypothetical protein